LIRVEPLEDRRVLSVSFSSFQVSQTVGGGTGFVMHGLTKGPDSALYFAYENLFGTPMGRDVGRIDTSGNFQLFALPSSAFPEGITNGPDGAVWTGDDNSTTIYRTTTTGTTTSFETGEPMTAVTTGPDGALWFTAGHFVDFLNQSALDKIRRITTSGTETLFPLPTPDAVGQGGLPGIVAGPDGALWFTDIGNNKIGRITTAGAITEFPVPTANALVSSAAPVAGPDGAIWFVERSKIGRITTSGAVTEFALPANQSPSSIAAGPDGALWYTDSGTNSLGRINTAGNVSTETAIPGAATGFDTPQQLVLGPSVGFARMNV
jgi:virginiamycin B lyase